MARSSDIGRLTEIDRLDLGIPRHVRPADLHQLGAVDQQPRCGRQTRTPGPCRARSGHRDIARARQPLPEYRGARSRARRRRARRAAARGAWSQSRPRSPAGAACCVGKRRGEFVSSRRAMDGGSQLLLQAISRLTSSRVAMIRRHQSPPAAEPFRRYRKALRFRAGGQVGIELVDPEGARQASCKTACKPGDR